MHSSELHLGHVQLFVPGPWVGKYAGQEEWKRGILAKGEVAGNRLRVGNDLGSKAKRIVLPACAAERHCNICLTTHEQLDCLKIPGVILFE